MACNGTGNSSVKIPQLGHFSPYEIPAQDVTVKCSQDQSSRNKKKNLKMKLNKNSNNEIKSENLEGHKTFDNIEDILTFINGEISKEEAQNDAPPNDKLHEPQSQEQTPVHDVVKMLEMSLLVVGDCQDPTLKWERRVRNKDEDYVLHKVGIETQLSEEKRFTIGLHNVLQDDAIYGNVFIDQIGFLPQRTHPLFELKDPSRSKDEITTVGLEPKEEYRFDVICKASEEGLHKVDLLIKCHAKAECEKVEIVCEEKIIVGINMQVKAKNSLGHLELAAVNTNEKSLGAIRKIRKVKRYGEKVIDANINELVIDSNINKFKKNEKEKPDLSKPVGDFFRGWFSKQDSEVQHNQLEVDEYDETEQFEDTKEILSNEFVSIPILNGKSEIFCFDSAESEHDLDSATAKMKKACKEAEVVKKACKEAEVAGAEAAVSVVELSNKFIEVWDNVERGNGTITQSQAQLEALQSALEAVTNIEEKIDEVLLVSANRNIFKQVNSLMELIGGAKKGLQINEKQTKLKQETFKLKNQRIGLYDEKITITEEMIKLNSEDQVDNSNSVEESEEMSLLKQKVEKNMEFLNENENEMSLCKKKLDELSTEKEAQNQLLKETLDKIEPITESPQKEQLVESPQEKQLAIEHKSTENKAEDAKQEPLRESTYELTFHKTSLTTFKTSGKEDLPTILDNCALVLAATNWSVIEWGIHTPHPECHEKLDEENQRRRCKKEICQKCRHDLKGCGPDLRTCGRCEIVTKAIAYHEEYLRMVEVVEKGGKGRALKKQVEGLGKDAMRSFQNAMVPFLVTCIEGESTYFLEYQEEVPVEKGGACKLADIWERLLYVKFSLRRVRIDQDFLVHLRQRADDARSATLEYEDVLDDFESYLICWRELVEMWDSNVAPSFSAPFQQTEKDLESWSRCAERSKDITEKAFDMIETAEKASSSGKRSEIVDLKCVEAFLCSALSFTNAAKDAVDQKLPVKMVQRMHWAKELLKKIHCVRCRRIILIPGENLVHLDKCSKCKAVRYCNTTCQQLQWEDHKDKCGQLKKAEKRRKKKESQAGEKLVRKKEKFWEQVMKPLLCTPGVTLECLDTSLQQSQKGPFI